MAKNDPRPLARKGAEVVCAGCGKSVYMPPSKIKRGDRCCSIACRDAVKRSKTYNDTDGTKKCSRCGEWKSLDGFAVQRGGKVTKVGDSRQSYCRPCSVVKSGEWAAANPAAKRVIAKRSAEKYAGRTKKPLTPEQRARRNTNHAAWRKANGAKVAMWNRLRIHRMRCAGDMPCRLEIGAMLCSQDARCTYCGSMLGDNYHIDHKTPVSRGGTNDTNNLQLLCPTCNMKKGAKTHEEYAQKVGIAKRRRVRKGALGGLDVEAFCRAMEIGNYQAALDLTIKALTT